MKNAYWIPMGLVVGFAVGILFGFDYAIAGSAIGALGGAGIFVGMGVAGSSRKP